MRTGECDLGALPVEETGRLGETSVLLHRLKLAPLPSAITIFILPRPAKRVRG